MKRSIRAPLLTVFLSLPLLLGRAEPFYPASDLMQFRESVTVDGETYHFSEEALEESLTVILKKLSRDMDKLQTEPQGASQTALTNAIAQSKLYLFTGIYAAEMLSPGGARLDAIFDETSKLLGTEKLPPGTVPPVAQMQAIAFMAYAGGAWKGSPGDPSAVGATATYDDLLREARTTIERRSKPPASKPTP